MSRVPGERPTHWLSHSLICPVIHSDTGPARHSASLSPDWVIMSDFGRLLDLQGHVRGGVQTFRLMEPRAGLSAHLGIFFQDTDALGSPLSCTLWGTVYLPPYYLGIPPGAALSHQMLTLASTECPTVLRSTLMVMEMGSQDGWAVVARRLW